MTARNDITGDKIQSFVSGKKFEAKNTEDDYSMDLECAMSILLRHRLENMKFSQDYLEEATKLIKKSSGDSIKSVLLTGDG